MNEHIVIETERFKLSLDFQVFDSDISYPANTILSVNVLSNGFSASATMDIDIMDVASFCVNLQKIYNSLSGEAKIQEPFGNRQYLLFSGDQKGHILISGVLNSNGANGFWQELKFENRIDQTHLPLLIERLDAISRLYLN